MMMDVEISQMANGLRVATARIPHVASVSIGLWVGVGGRHESAKQAGISHFIEHMLFKGTRRRSAREISQAIEGRGGHINAMTQEDCTGYYAHVGYDRTREALDILLDMYISPRFAAGELAREQGVIIEEIMMYKDLPHHQVQEMLNEALWHGHPLGRPLVGTRETVAAMMCRDLAGYKQRTYLPGNTVAAFAGRVDHEKCLAEVNRLAGRVKGGRLPRCIPVTAKVPQIQMALGGRDVEQTHLAMGVRLPFGRKSKHRFALTLLNTVLGGNMSSRLFQIVREKYGLAYSIHSTVHLMDETGVWLISSGLDRQQYLKALALIAGELERVKRSRVSRTELRRAKDYCIGQFRLALESTTSHMARAAENTLFFGRFIPPEETIQKLQDISAADIQQLANRTLRPSRVSIAMIGPELSDNSCGQVRTNALAF